LSLQTLINLGAGLWFFACWIGYTHFARHKARKDRSLSSVLQMHRQRWMQIMLSRENRMTDAALIASLERNATFLASTSMFIIAGLITITASIDQVYHTIAAVPFTNASMTPLQLQLKVILLLFNFVYAFLSLTWSMRQYGFCSILLGAAPLHNEQLLTAEDRTHYANNMAQVIDNAGLSYNYGLRAFYFSLSILPWFFNTWLFIASVTLVVIILYRREFHSGTLHTLAKSLEYKSKG